jgi:hypothetical protein
VYSLYHRWIVFEVFKEKTTKNSYLPAATPDDASSSSSTQQVVVVVLTRSWPPPPSRSEAAFQKLLNTCVKQIGTCIIT